VKRFSKCPGSTDSSAKLNCHLYYQWGPLSLAESSSSITGSNVDQLFESIVHFEKHHSEQIGDSLTCEVYRRTDDRESAREYEANPPVYSEYLRTEFLFYVTHWSGLAYLAFEQGIRRMHTVQGRT
jgi:hypothetical protein